MNNEKKKNINLWILFLSLIVFSIRWYYPLVNFDEEIDVKLIFESVSDGYYYFSHFKALANLNLNNSFDPLVSDLRNYPIPTAAFTIHFIFYKIFGSIGFIICEFIFILLFFIIFYKISRLLNFSRIESLTISFILYNIPYFLQFAGIDHIKYVSVMLSEFYSLRFPRPLVSNIFFFIFISYLMKLNYKNIFTKRNSIYLGIISGLSFTSFFYVFILEQIFLILFLFSIFKFKLINKIKDNLKYFGFYIFSFFLISSPFLINMNFTEIEFLERTGLINLNLEKKIILFNHMFFRLFKYQFLIIFLLSLLLMKLINLDFFNSRFKKLNIFFIIFYSSILAPFIFILISPIFYSHFYLFNNLIVICAFLMIFFTFISLIKFYFFKSFSVNFINNSSIFFLVFFLTISFYQNNKNYKNSHLTGKKVVERKEFNLIVNKINKINSNKKNYSLLTFDNRFLVWSILNDVKYLNIVNGVMVPKKHSMIENDLISTFKYLGLTRKDLQKFIENQKISSWRYRNENVKNLFWMRYQANSMITHKDTKDFDPEVLEFINQSSPLLSQQLIMPNNEIQRLLLKFDQTLVVSYKNPEIIIINKTNSILNKSIVDENIFCKAFEGKFYVLYYSLFMNPLCKN